MPMVRVLDLRDTYEIGGPGKTILETYRFIDRRRFDLHLGVFLLEGESDDSPFLREARAVGMPVHLIRGGSRFDPRLVTRTAALTRALAVDILHAHEVKSDVISWAARPLCRRPIVTTMHGWIANSPKQRAFVALDKAVARRYDCVIAVSNRIRQDLLDAGVPENRIRLVHNAIVPERYRRTGERGRLAAIAGREVPGPVLLAVGRLSAEKGHADLLDAVALVCGRGRRISLVLAGDGPERGRLEARVRDLGIADQVVFAGYVDGPQRLLEEADLAVLPSHTEGLPNAALEALIMDVPVLATRVGGTPEVIDDGVTGRLVPARDAAALATGIDEFLAQRDAWTQMAVRGHQVVLNRFDFRARTRKVEELYCEMLEEP